jgi:NACalpha-BTF3-like transcription factor
MPLETISWVFPGLLFLLTVLFGIVWGFLRSEVKDLKDADDENDRRFQALESRIEKSNDEVRSEARQMVRESKEITEKDIALVRADVREQTSQIREAMHRMESNIINQMKLLITAHNP